MDNDNTNPSEHAAVIAIVFFILSLAGNVFLASWISDLKGQNKFMRGKVEFYAGNTLDLKSKEQENYELKNKINQLNKTMNQMLVEQNMLSEMVKSQHNTIKSQHDTIKTYKKTVGLYRRKTKRYNRK